MPNKQWILSAFDLSPSPDAERVVMALRVVAALGVAVVLLNYAILKRLLAIVGTTIGG